MPPNLLGSSGDRHLDSEVGGGEHVHEAVDAEQVDLASHQVGDPWLGDAEELGCRRLREVLTADVLRDLSDQGRSDAQVLCLGGGVLDGVPDAVVGLDAVCHRSFLISPYRCLARSRSAFEVFWVFFWKACSTYTVSSIVAT